MGRQHLEACKSWRRGQNRQNSQILRGTKNSVMVCARAVGLDQWVTRIRKNDNKGLGVGK